MADVNNNPNDQGQQTTGAGTTQQNQQTQQNNQNKQTPGGDQNQPVDVEKVKSDAVEEYLRGLGYDDEALKGIIAKQKEEEEANKTDLQKTQDQLQKTTKKLIEERNGRILAEAKLAALKLGAKAELVDDLVTVAMAKVTKDKDIDAIVAEIKAGPTGSIYFETETDPEDKNKNLTGGAGTGGATGSGTNNQKQKKQNNAGPMSDEDFINRMKAQRATVGKSKFFRN